MSDNVLLCVSHFVNAKEYYKNSIKNVKCVYDKGFYKQIKRRVPIRWIQNRMFLFLLYVVCRNKMYTCGNVYSYGLIISLTHMNEK